MADQLSICNLALSYLGFTPLTALDTSTKTGIACLATWDIILDEVLAAEAWNFATKRVQLVQTSNTPLYDYRYTYQLPDDRIKIIGIHDHHGRHHHQGYVVEGSTLLSNNPYMKIKYIYRVTEPGYFSPGFVSCFAARLAAALCYQLIDNPAKRSQELLQIYASLRKEAVLADAREEYEQPRERDSWLRYRTWSNFDHAPQREE